MLLYSLNLDYWNNGVLEYWSVGRKRTNYLHYSITPISCSYFGLFRLGGYFEVLHIWITHFASIGK